MGSDTTDEAGDPSPSSQLNRAKYSALILSFTYSQHELGLLADHVLFTPLWISVLINIPVLRSRKTIPLIEISLWLFGISSLSERLGNPNVIFNFRGIESD